MSGKCNKSCATCVCTLLADDHTFSALEATALTFMTPDGERRCSACHYKRSANEVCDFMNEHPECYKGHGRNIQGIVMTKALNDLKKSIPRLSPTLTHLAEEIYKKKMWFKFSIIEKDGRYEVGTISTDPTYKKEGKPVMFLTREVAIKTIKDRVSSNVLAKNRKHDLIHDLVLEDGTGKTKTYSLRFSPQVVTPTTRDTTPTTRDTMDVSDVSDVSEKTDIYPWKPSISCFELNRDPRPIVFTDESRHHIPYHHRGRECMMCHKKAACPSTYIGHNFQCHGCRKYKK
jgi:hypothetical protein